GSKLVNATLNLCNSVTLNLALKLSVHRCPRKRNHIPDIRHSRYKKHKSFKSESETGMDRASESAGVEIPPQFFFVDSDYFHFLEQHIITLFTLRSAYDFTDSREQNIHCGYGFSVFVQSHVKRF